MAIVVRRAEMTDVYWTRSRFVGAFRAKDLSRVENATLSRGAIAVAIAIKEERRPRIRQAVLERWFFAQRITDADVVKNSANFAFAAGDSGAVDDRLNHSGVEHVPGIYGVWLAVVRACIAVRVEQRGIRGASIEA